MTVVVCLDDSGGMMFNNRRQSRDRVVTERIAEECGGGKLRMNAYSAKLFDGYENVFVSENFLEEAEDGDVCFTENRSLKEFENKISKFIIYRWNRRYPGDFFFDVPLSEDGWKLTESEEFAGNSHEKITREVYIR